jgi:hypothetical protein
LKIKNINNINVKDFEILFKEFYNDLCNFALKYTKNKYDAEEVVQDVPFLPFIIIITKVVQLIFRWILFD